MRSGFAALLPSPAVRPPRRAFSIVATSASRAPPPPSGSVRVYLIGAGPGGVDHLTVKAARLLRACDAVVYDDLGASSEDILRLLPDHCERHYVGKRGGEKNRARSWKQPDIDALLVRLALRGDLGSIARLKGGCPGVFGRVSSELAALRASSIAHELVPGVSSALAAPLRAGFPLTDKTLSRHFAVVSAHDPAALDYAAFERIDTVVFLMVGSTVADVAEGMARDRAEGGAGWDPETPACVVRSAAAAAAVTTEWEGEGGGGVLGGGAGGGGGGDGGDRGERVWRFALRDAREAVGAEGNLSPCVMIVGEVTEGGAGEGGGVRRKVE